MWGLWGLFRVVNTGLWDIGPKGGHDASGQWIVQWKSLTLVNADAIC